MKEKEKDDTKEVFAEHDLAVAVTDPEAFVATIASTSSAVCRSLVSTLSKELRWPQGDIQVAARLVEVKGRRLAGAGDTNVIITYTVYLRPGDNEASRAKLAPRLKTLNSNLAATAQTFDAGLQADCGAAAPRLSHSLGALRAVPSHRLQTQPSAASVGFRVVLACLCAAALMGVIKYVLLKPPSKSAQQSPRAPLSPKGAKERQGSVELVSRPGQPQPSEQEEQRLVPDSAGIRSDISSAYQDRFNEGLGDEMSPELAMTFSFNTSVLRGSISN